MDNKEEIRMVSQTTNKKGDVIRQIYDRYINGKYFATVFTRVYGTASGLRRSTRTVFAEPQENFECEFGQKMKLKMFEERRDIATDRVCERSYVNTFNEVFSKNYLTGECSFRNRLGLVTKSRVPVFAETLMRLTNRNLGFDAKGRDI